MWSEGSDMRIQLPEGVVSPNAMTFIDDNSYQSLREFVTFTDDVSHKTRTMRKQDLRAGENELKAAISDLFPETGVLFRSLGGECNTGYAIFVRFFNLPQLIQ